MVPASLKQPAVPAPAIVQVVTTVPTVPASPLLPVAHKTTVHLIAWSVRADTVLIRSLAMQAVTAPQVTPVTPVKTQRLAFLTVRQTVRRIANVLQDNTANSSQARAKAVVETMETVPANVVAQQAVAVTALIAAPTKPSVMRVILVQATVIALVERFVAKPIAWNA
ncbi:MAG: hypothetical protein CMH60_01770 [Myxococcales bacterium]|nr:hypothetical protein [Myxococcales bacterium]